MRRRSAAAVVAALAVAGCTAILGVGEVHYSAADDGGPASDAIATDAGTEAEPDAHYADIRDPANWQALLVNEDLGLLPSAWTGALYDGRFVTFQPRTLGFYVMRYDTMSGFDRRAAWTQTRIDGIGEGGPYYVAGCAFDGARLYMPLVADTVQPDLAVWLDAGDDAAWATMSLSPGGASVWRTRPAADERYLYIPSSIDHATGRPAGAILRVDTQTLPTPTTLSVDTLQVLARTSGYANAVLVKGYLYVVPGYVANWPAGYAARIEATKFGDVNAWEYLDAAGLVTPSALGFESATFDGQYLYMWGAPTGLGSNAVAVRYDTKGDFRQSSNWQSIDFRPAADADASAPGAAYFAGSTFDGRYVYAIVNDQAGDTIELARYDTQAAFVAASLEHAPLPQVLSAHPNLPATLSFTGAGFDGQFVYLAPNSNATSQFDNAVVRFHAKDPPSLPGTARSSFF
jgi:hypothetical protein